MAGRSVEGSLRIDLLWRDRRVDAVTITSSRPLRLPEVFIGKRPEEVCTMLPLLYSVCGQAQGGAAVEAFEQAQSLVAAPRTRQLRRTLIAFETIKEHLWRVEVDWRRELGKPAEHAALARVAALQRRFRAALCADPGSCVPGAPSGPENQGEALATLDELEALLQDVLFQAPPAHWLAQVEAGGLSDWLMRQQCPAQMLLRMLEQAGETTLGEAVVPALGNLDEAALNQRLVAADAGAFIALPDWQGAVRETTPFSRRREHPLLRELSLIHGGGLFTRLVARVLEVALLVSEVRATLERTDSDPVEADFQQSSLAPGVGLAQMEAARGRLVHRVEMVEGRVSNYQIVAPTEWNFHPRGVLAQALEGMKARSEGQLRARAGLLITAIDPCVDYQIAITQDP